MLIFIGIKGPTFTQFSYNTKLLGRGIQKNKIYVYNISRMFIATNCVIKKAMMRLLQVKKIVKLSYIVQTQIGLVFNLFIYVYGNKDIFVTHDKN